MTGKGVIARLLVVITRGLVVIARLLVVIARLHVVITRGLHIVIARGHVCHCPACPGNPAIKPIIIENLRFSFYPVR